MGLLFNDSIKSAILIAIVSYLITSQAIVRIIPKPYSIKPLLRMRSTLVLVFRKIDLIKAFIKPGPLVIVICFLKGQKTFVFVIAIKRFLIIQNRVSYCCRYFNTKNFLNWIWMGEPLMIWLLVFTSNLYTTREDHHHHSLSQHGG